MSLINSNSGGPLSAGGLLTPTPVKAAAYLAVPGDLIPVDTTGGAVTVTLPAAPADQSMVGVKMVKQGGTNAVTVACGGADTFNTVAGSASGTLSLLKQGMIIQYQASIAVWYVLDDSLPLSGLDARYASASGGTVTGAQTFDALVTLDGGTDTA